MEAFLYRKGDALAVHCDLCHHRCQIKPGRRGLCHVRENREGTLYSLVYGRLIARHVDPIEKKPLFHVLPGSRSYSIATVGCNFRCRFCQNADIAQLPADRGGAIAGERTTPETVVADALARGCRTIAYTYTEPTVFFEFARDTARLAAARGLRNVFVTNGYLTTEALDAIHPHLHAANVDLKAFSDDFYRRYCGARLDGVLETLREMHRRGVLVEVTTLVIPGLNDSPEELRALAAFLVEALGPQTPWHVSRFHPTYRLTDRGPTPVATLAAARQIGISAGLANVYMGNVPGQGGEDTVCPGCGRTVIARRGFQVEAVRLADGCCADCGEAIEGIWD
jgi:pyruvate formate lyase activating enzyme